MPFIRKKRRIIFCLWCKGNTYTILFQMDLKLFQRTPGYRDVKNTKSFQSEISFQKLNSSFFIHHNNRSDIWLSQMLSALQCSCVMTSEKRSVFLLALFSIWTHWCYNMIHLRLSAVTFLFRVNDKRERERCSVKAALPPAVVWPRSAAVCCCTGLKCCLLERQIWTSRGHTTMHSSILPLTLHQESSVSPDVSPCVTVKWSTSVPDGLHMPPHHLSAEFSPYHLSTVSSVSRYYH